MAFGVDHASCVMSCGHTDLIFVYQAQALCRETDGPSICRIVAVLYLYIKSQITTSIIDRTASGKGQSSAVFQAEPELQEDVPVAE